MLRFTPFLLCAALLATHPTLAASDSDKGIKFNFENAEITSVLNTYSNASGQKFVIDPSVRGKISILSKKNVSLAEAFDLLSTALALNQFAISEQGDTMVVMSTRNIQRSLVPVLRELPPLKPERIVTMVFQLKNASAEEINKTLRILPSKDGEMTPYTPGNQLIVNDWVSNIHKIAKVLAEIDQPKTK
jgi:general secretion pathway protein D